MEIQPVQNISPTRIKISKKIDKMYSRFKLKLKTLAYDVFERHGYYKDKKDGKWKRERDLPSCITRPSEYDGIVWGKTIFTPEDVEKMLSMNKEERYLYMRKLIEEGKYTEEWPE